MFPLETIHKSFILVTDNGILRCSLVDDATSARLWKPVEKRPSGPTSLKKHHLPVRVVANINIEYPWVNNTWQITFGFVSLK